MRIGILIRDEIGGYDMEVDMRYGIAFCDGWCYFMEKESGSDEKVQADRVVEIFAIQD